MRDVVSLAEIINAKMKSRNSRVHTKWFTEFSRSSRTFFEKFYCVARETRANRMGKKFNTAY